MTTATPTTVAPTTAVPTTATTTTAVPTTVSSTTEVATTAAPTTLTPSTTLIISTPEEPPSQGLSLAHLQMRITTFGDVSNGTIIALVKQFFGDQLPSGTAHTVTVTNLQRVQVST
ncbi:hypothetical protein NQZ68_004866 [Dissostichus eleginoides]|nr:hypothetical protein NQZ68_004866 [Dissostichus eleginoides]